MELERETLLCKKKIAVLCNSKWPNFFNRGLIYIVISNFYLVDYNNVSRFGSCCIDCSHIFYYEY